MKTLEGKKVWLRPTGNNTRYKKITTGKIINVKRVFLEVIFENSNYPTKFRYKDNKLENGYNSGYVIYETKKELDDYYKKNELALKLSEKLTYSRNFLALPLEDLEKIDAIVNKKNG